jgi:hypothetical protein
VFVYWIRDVHSKWAEEWSNFIRFVKTNGWNCWPSLPKCLFHNNQVDCNYRNKQFPVVTISRSDTPRSYCKPKLPVVRTTCTLDTIKRDVSILRHITLSMRGRHNICRMTLPIVLFIMLYCRSGIRAMSIQNESDHTQLEDLRQTVADLSTKIEVLNETIRKGKTCLIRNWCTTILLSLCCRGRNRMVSLFWSTSTCAITAYQHFKFEFHFWPWCYIFNTTVHKKVCSCLFVFIGNSGMILLK